MAAGHMDFGLETPDKPRTLALPPPTAQGGMTLIQALKARRSSREFSAKELPLQVLGDLLWSAFGVNRPRSGGRTAPSAHDWEEIDLYVALKSGLHVYRAKEHALRQVSAQDVRGETGIQPFVAQAPLDLVYVADLSRMTQASEEEKRWYSGPDAGFIAQNVYLFCASAGLATVVRGMVDRAALAKTLRLKPDQQIILAQTVGYPA
jgi:SagB-type dehydrogenase family enzyme